MANLAKLSDELMLMITANLDSASLKALAMTCSSIRECVSDVHSTNMTINVSTGSTAVYHKVFAYLLSAANDASTQLPQCSFDTTGDVTTVRVIQLASSFKVVKLRLFRSSGASTHVSQQLAQQYASLLTHLEPGNPTNNTNFWATQFRNDGLTYLVHLLLKAVRHLDTLEVANISLWRREPGLSGWCTGLRTLRLNGILEDVLFEGWDDIFNLPSLTTLEFVSMSVTSGTLQYFRRGSSEGLPVTCLRFIDCFVAIAILRDAVQACRSLLTFEYSLNDLYRPRQGRYDISPLLHHLGLYHGTSLKNLTIRMSSHALTCHHLEDFAQLQSLRTLSVSFDLLRPADLILSLAASLERLELHFCDKTLATLTLLRIMHSMKASGELAKLCTIKATFRNELPWSPFEIRWLQDLELDGQTRTRALQTLAGTFPDDRKLYLELQDLPSGQQDRAPPSVPWRP